MSKVIWFVCSGVDIGYFWDTKALQVFEGSQAIRASVALNARRFRASLSHRTLAIS
jgi:hypothetical protein